MNEHTGTPTHTPCALATLISLAGLPSDHVVSDIGYAFADVVLFSQDTSLPGKLLIL